MASELSFVGTPSQANVYALLVRQGQVWSTVAGAWVTPVVVDWANYKISFTETPSGSGIYVADAPAGLPAGTAQVIVRRQTGAAAVPADPALGLGELAWDGAAEVDLAVGVNVTKISGDSAAADALEAVLDGTGAVLTLTQLRVNANTIDGAIDVDNAGGAAASFMGTLLGIGVSASGGDAIYALSSGGGGSGLSVRGNGVGDGLRAQGGVSGAGMKIMGGTTAGYALRIESLASGDQDAVMVYGHGAGKPLESTLFNQIVDGVWDELKAGHVTAATFGAYLDAQISTRSTHSAADVWAVGTRTLTGFGTLAADVAAAVWAAGTRTLTGFGTLAADVAVAVWAAGSRTLTGFGTLVADLVAALALAHGAGSWETDPWAGDGDVAVDHDYGGVDVLRVTFGGVPGDGATIRAYLKSEHEAGQRRVVATARTGSDGRWIAPMMLDVDTHVLVISAPGRRSKSVEVTVK